MSGFNICGMVVRSRDERCNDVRASLLAIPGVGIHPSLGRRAVDCHKGIAHELPDMVEEDASVLSC